MKYSMIRMIKQTIALHKTSYTHIRTTGKNVDLEIQQENMIEQEQLENNINKEITTFKMDRSSRT